MAAQSLLKVSLLIDYWLASTTVACVNILSHFHGVRGRGNDLDYMYAKFHVPPVPKSAGKQGHRVC